MPSDSVAAAWQPPEFPCVEEALSADCVVTEERGRWIVYLDVVLASGAHAAASRTTPCGG